MIINVRGTHGSGKTTLVRKIMAMYKYREPIYGTTDRGKQKILGYVCRDKKAPHACTRVLFVAGHYESVTGGCDTIPKVAKVYELVRRFADLGYDVLFEGILAQHSTPNIKALHDDDYRMRVLVLDVSRKKAIRSVLKRRAQRGNLRPFDPRNVRKEHASVRSAASRLTDYGVRVVIAKSRRRALTRVVRWLRLGRRTGS